MDGVTQANYAQSYAANVGAPQQPRTQPTRQSVSNGATAPQKGVAAINTQKLSFGGNVGSNVRPEEMGAKVTRSVDGDTISISAEGQARVRQAAEARETPDVASATARVQSATAERPEQTIYDRPQGGGIERPEFERPQVQQIQDDAEEAQAVERTEPQPRTEQAEAVEEEEPAEEEEEEGEVDTSNLRQYSNSELRQLLYQGQITQKQYDDEMKSRQTDNDKKSDRKVLNAVMNF